MEEDLPSCARLRRGAGFSHRGRGAPLSPRRPDRRGFGALYASERGNRKGQGRLCHEPGEVSLPVAISSGPPKSTSRPINASASHVESSPGPEYGVRPTHARGRALADSQDQKPLVELSHKPLGKIPQTVDICGLRRARQTERRDAKQTDGARI
jgi:hypothetical protein